MCKLNRILTLIRYFVVRYWFSISPDSFYNYDGCPKRCTICGCQSFHSVVKDTLEGSVCEERIICDNCGAIVSYWAYGYYDPTFKVHGAVKKE